MSFGVIDEHVLYTDKYGVFSLQIGCINVFPNRLVVPHGYK